jgi:hypothetical protein
VAAWREHAGGPYREVWLPGAEHAFVVDPPELLLRLVATEVLSPAAARSGGDAGAAGAAAAAVGRSWSAPELDALATGGAAGAARGGGGAPAVAEGSEGSQQPAPGTPQQGEAAARSESATELPDAAPGGAPGSGARRRWLCCCLGGGARA